MSLTQREYQIQYAVFFNPTTASFHALSNPTLSDSLVHSCNVPRIRNRDGSWLSSSKTASLRLLYGSGAANLASQVMLVISLSGVNHEEHFISKLHFSWPLTSSASENPAKGGRVVFASYKDSKGQVQKFAMRFRAVFDSESFINALKECLKNVRTIVVPGKESESVFQSQDGCIPAENLHESLTSEVNNECPNGNGTQPVPPSSNDVINNTQETMLINFAAFLAKHEHSNVPKEAQHFSSLMNSMSSASFMAMLYSMEKVITDLGGDLSLQPQ